MLDSFFPYPLVEQRVSALVTLEKKRKEGADAMLQLGMWWLLLFLLLSTTGKVKEYFCLKLFKKAFVRVMKNCWRKGSVHLWVVIFNLSHYFPSLRPFVLLVRTFRTSVLWRDRAISFVSGYFYCLFCNLLSIMWCFNICPICWVKFCSSMLGGQCCILGAKILGCLCFSGNDSKLSLGFFVFITRFREPPRSS